MFTDVIDVPIFEQSVILICGTKDEAVKILTDTYNMPLDDADDFANSLCPKRSRASFCYSEKYDIYVIWMPIVPKTFKDYVSVVHEVEHAVFYLLDNMGFEHTSASDEMYAYLSGYLFEQIEVAVTERNEGLTCKSTTVVSKLLDKIKTKLD